MQVLPLGAGQDVGRSCIIVTVASKTIMFDCGIHMGFNDHRRFPNFDLISPNQRHLDGIVDVVLISHFHLDHSGALPFLTEQRGYNGPIIMTAPTRALCPLLIEDYRKIVVERKGVSGFFTSEDIHASLNKVRCIGLHETIELSKGFTIKAHYAGHVLGAAMFQVCVDGESIIYTGDYNLTPDRHLGAADIPRVNPSVLITETTYATMVRDSKRVREHRFLQRCKSCVEQGGKVLIPVFSMGRAQELCLLVDQFWERMNLKHVPVYFSQGMTNKANDFYKLFIPWTNEKIKRSFVDNNRNQFEFKNITVFERQFALHPGPMVVFATPGMLHAGQSLELFKQWCGNEKNLCILPGYCVAGTVGNKVLTGHKTIDIDGQNVEVKCQIANLSFSAHVDAKGIMQMIEQTGAKSVVLVHGEKANMLTLQSRIKKQFKIPCFSPANGTRVKIPRGSGVAVDLSTQLLDRARDVAAEAMLRSGVMRPLNEFPVQGTVVVHTTPEGEKRVRVVSYDEATRALGLTMKKRPKVVCHDDDRQDPNS